uniref:Uncharacterized protein n=1 Tax=Burkholderia sp. (strain CCGE1003) TaxID=640512 RepID=E1TFI8_BURSG
MRLDGAAYPVLVPGDGRFFQPGVEQVVEGLTGGDDLRAGVFAYRQQP